MSKPLQNPTDATRHIAVFAFHQVMLLDIAGPTQVFTATNQFLGRTAYALSVLSHDGRPVVTDTGVQIGADGCLSAMPAGHDLLVPGGPGVDPLLDDAATLVTLTTVAQRAKRLIGICSGSLLLAATGLLDGKRATSHWVRSPMLRTRFPRVDWQLDQIFTQDGPVYCSAGVTTGIDLALAIVAQDHSRALALDIARELVVFMQRGGGQSQYSHPLKAQTQTVPRLAGLCARIAADPTEDWRIGRMAAIAGMTDRTLLRHFLRHAGQTPSHYVESIRVGLARTLLEGGSPAIKQVAAAAGFGSEQALRRAFVRQLNVTPQDYRDRFGQRP
jgi:transcriptional regulator GlxA family with amidase domain